MGLGFSKSKKEPTGIVRVLGQGSILNGRTFTRGVLFGLDVLGKVLGAQQLHPSDTEHRDLTVMKKP